MVVAAVLAAAVLHAGWNAIAKGVTDRLGLFARASVVEVALGAAAVWFVAPPRAAAVPWMLASVCVHVLYNLGLIAAYRVGDFNQTYPLARGIGPLVVAVVGATVLHEPLPPIQLAGVLLIGGAIGVLGLTPWRKVSHNRAAVLAAVLTGLAIATYTLLDGIGVRRSGSPIGYAVWLLASHAALTIPIAAMARRTRWAASGQAGQPGRRTAPWTLAAVAGVMAMLAYGLVLWAQAHGALAAVAALRESSVVVAAVLGVIVFREPLGRVRIAASVAVAAGVVLLAWA
jgi:drug/metabolite transporter (DMT)-like permease